MGIFWAKGKVFSRCGRPQFLMQLLRISKFMVCPYGQEGWYGHFSDKGEGSFISDFVRKSFMDDP